MNAPVDLGSNVTLRPDPAAGAQGGPRPPERASRDEGRAAASAVAEAAEREERRRPSQPGQTRRMLELHPSSGRWLLRVLDRNTGRVVRTVPPEALLDTIGRIRRYVGQLLDRRV